MVDKSMTWSYRVPANAKTSPPHLGLDLLWQLKLYSASEAESMKNANWGTAYGQWRYSEQYGETAA